jgi:hypothetical protein
MGRKRRLLTSVIVAMLVTMGGSAAAAPALIRQSSGPLTATLAPSTHTPKINTPVPIVVTATLSGKPVRATAVYEFLFNGAIVSTTYPYGNKHYTFTGHFSDKLNFPPSSLGFPLTFRVVIKAGGRTVNLNCTITSHK